MPPHDEEGRIGDFYAWIAAMPDGREGVLAVPNPHGGMMQLCGATLEGVAGMRDVARDAAEITGMRLALVRFERVETLDRIG